MAQIRTAVQGQDNVRHNLIIEDNTFVDENNVSNIAIPIQDIFVIKTDDSRFAVHYASYSKPTEAAEPETKSLRPKAVSRELNVELYKPLEGFDVTAADGYVSPNDFFDDLRKRLQIQSLQNNTQIHAILNPVSGLRQSTENWKNIISPMLSLSGIADDRIHLHTTKAALDGNRLAKDLALKVLAKSDDPIILLCIGGDGTLHEVINGLSQTSVESKLKLVVIPSGSGNAFANALGITDPVDAILRLLRGNFQPLRTIRVSFGKCTEPYDSQNWHNHVEYQHVDHEPRIMVVFSFGFHTQIVSKSNYLRPFMGNSRFSLVAGFLLWWMPQYGGRLVLDEGAQEYDAKQQNWRTVNGNTNIDGQYTYFLGSKMPELEPGFRIAPFASTSDDHVDLVLLRDGTSDELKSILYKAFQKGSHITEPKLEYWKAKGFVLRVQDAAEVCLDGEIHKVPKGGVIRLQVVQPSTQGEISIDVFM
ncbi:ATP-NAD kinase-like domain-containing protein [Umbelopsis sp. PMI_123]|nr:ATP-NAD kinase-like domain-containing protein [Umbelopsis sp. PMI_123]